MIYGAGFLKSVAKTEAPRIDVEGRADKRLTDRLRGWTALSRAWDRGRERKGDSGGRIVVVVVAVERGLEQLLSQLRRRAAEVLYRCKQ